MLALARRAHRHGSAADRDRSAELITRQAVYLNGREFLSLSPGRAIAREDVGRSLILFSVDVVALGAYYQRVAVERHRKSEDVSRRAVGGGEFLLQRPGRAVAREDVNRTLSAVRADGVPKHTHRQCVAVERGRRAEVFSGSAILGGQLLLFDA